MISNGLPPVDGGGAERYVAELVEALSSRGHQILVLSRVAVSLPAAQVVGVGGAPPLDETGPETAKAIWHLADQWRPNVHRTVAGHLRRFAPDVVHSHNVQRLSAAPFTAVAAAGVPHVHTAHDFNLMCLRASFTRDGTFCGGRCLSCAPQRLVRSRALRLRLDRLIAPSDYVAERHVQFGVASRERTMVIRQGARPGITRIRTAGERPVVGFIGTISAAKGIRTLLRAADRAAGAWQLEIAGDGPIAGEVAEAARRLEWVSFRGRVDGAAREQFYDGIDLLVIPSEWEENAPLVATEAAIRGIPGVVSDRGGLPEIPLATTFPARDAPALAETIARVCRDGRMEEASRELISQGENFKWSTHVERVENVLAEVAMGAGRPLSSSG
jgi:glycosyltransferase involved in cell wall biosynthesis